MFFFLHGGDNVWHWFDKNLELCGANDWGSVSMAIYEQVPGWWKAKFLDSNEGVVFFMVVLGLWSEKRLMVLDGGV